MTAMQQMQFIESPKSQIVHGDCLDVMRSMADNSISAIVTDPPYGLSFMGKSWDHSVPGPEFWQEVLRICKPGAFMIAMGGTRTFHRLTCAIEDAGWEIRDCISWLYGSGFPKSHNHFGIEGFGTALKPAWEPCIVAMKKCDGTFKQNAERWGQAGINIDECRIPTVEKLAIGSGKVGYEGGYINYHPLEQNPKGRWPANVILDEESSRLLDEQSGNSRSINSPRNNKPSENTCMNGANTGHISYGHSDSGGASRFFYCAKASSSERNEGLEELQDRICHRYSEKAQGPLPQQTPSKGVIEKNHHPTVKPLKLMEYLIKLIMPPKDGILLDPFAGSGSTILAAKNLGFDAIGIEKCADYCEIARARLL